MSKIQDRVEALLENFYDLRNSDKALLLEIWAQEGLVLSTDQKMAFMEYCTTPETITRARRKLKGKYPASKAVNEARYNKFERYRQGEIF